MKSEITMKSLLLVSASVLLTCGTTFAQSAGPVKPEPLGNLVYPMLRYISAGASDRAGRLDQLTPMDLADLYTSLKVTPACPIAGPHDNNATAAECGQPLQRDYDKERPSWLFRLFGTRTINIVALANVQITDPDLPISVPLFSMQHQTPHGAPDEYVSNYTSSHSATPLFRIGASSVFTLHVHQAMSHNETFTGVSTLIKAVQTATTIAAPHAALLTTLSSPDLSNASQAIDTAIGSILSSDKTEDIELAHDISLTFSDRNGRPSVYSIEARVPSGDVKYSYEPADQSGAGGGGYDDKSFPAPIIGHWYVWLSCPRPSMFSAEDICNSLAAMPSEKAIPPSELLRVLPSSVTASVAQITTSQAGSDATNNAYPKALNDTVVAVQNQVIARLAGRPSQVLNTKLSSQVIIEDFVTASDPYKTFFAKPTKQTSDTRKFCADLVDLLYKQGLNHFDARLVVWSMTRGLGDVITFDDAAKAAPATPSGGGTPPVGGPVAGSDIATACAAIVNPDPSGPNIRF